MGKEITMVVAVWRRDGEKRMKRLRVKLTSPLYQPHNVSVRVEDHPHTNLSWYISSYL